MWLWSNWRSSWKCSLISKNHLDNASRVEQQCLTPHTWQYRFSVVKLCCCFFYKSIYYVGNFRCVELGESMVCDIYVMMMILMAIKMNSVRILRGVSSWVKISLRINLSLCLFFCRSKKYMFKWNKRFTNCVVFCFFKCT